MVYTCPGVEGLPTTATQINVVRDTKSSVATKKLQMGANMWISEALL
jgi:hypothetical protein